METVTIGTALSRRRSELGIDQKGAAALIGMSRTSFSSYERDLQRPSVEVLPALATFLAVTTEEILTLYGATCIEAIRPSLDRLLATGELSTPPDASGDDHEAKGGPSTSTDFSDDLHEAEGEYSIQDEKFTDTSGEVHEDESSIQDEDVGEPGADPSSESTEASVSIFANELSDGMASPAKAAIAISPSQDLQPTSYVATSNTKKKKKKKKKKK